METLESLPMPDRTKYWFDSAGWTGQSGLVRQSLYDLRNGDWLSVVAGPGRYGDGYGWEVATVWYDARGTLHVDGEPMAYVRAAGVKAILNAYRDKITVHGYWDAPGDLHN